MLFMNHWEVEDAVRFLGEDPVLGPAARTLRNLMEWTNSHSDGWAYWPKPTRAAQNLMALFEVYYLYDTYHGVPVAGATVEEYRKALRPIKAFRTRQGADFEIEEA